MRGGDDLSTEHAPATDVDRPASVLAKLFAIFDAFLTDRPALSLTELARATGLPKSTVHRIVTDLLAWGALERTDHRLRPGPRLFELGGLVSHQRRLRAVAVPFLEDLYEATHEVVHLGVLDGIEVVYAEKIYGHRSIRVGTRVGGRMPVHCTAIGKALVAFGDPGLVERVVSVGLPRRTRYTITTASLFREELATIRSAGVAFDREEAMLGTICVASPVFDRQAGPVAAVSVTAPVERLDNDRLVPAVRSAALALSRSLRDRAPHAG